jgi:hypothetical protein
MQFQEAMQSTHQEMSACMRRTTPMVILPYDPSCPDGTGTTVYSHCRNIDLQLCEIQSQRDSEIGLCQSRAKERENREREAARERQAEEARQAQIASAREQQRQHAEQQDAVNKHLREVQQQREDRLAQAEQRRADRQQEVNRIQRDNVAQGANLLLSMLTNREPAAEPDYDSDRRQMEEESDRRRAASEAREEKMREEQAKHEKVEKEQSLYDRLSKELRDDYTQIKQTKDIAAADNPFLKAVEIVERRTAGGALDIAVGQAIPGLSGHDTTMDNTTFASNEIRSLALASNPFAKIISRIAADGVTAAGNKILGNADQVANDIRNFSIDTPNPFSTSQSKSLLTSSPSTGSASSNSSYASTSNPFDGAVQPTTYVDPATHASYEIPVGDILYRDPNTQQLSVINPAQLSNPSISGDDPTAGTQGCTTTGLGVVTPACEAQRGR